MVLWMTIRLIEASECPWMTTIVKEVSNSTMDYCHTVMVSNGIMGDNQANRGQELNHG